MLATAILNILLDMSYFLQHFFNSIWRVSDTYVYRRISAQRCFLFIYYVELTLFYFLTDVSRGGFSAVSVYCRRLAPVSRDSADATRPGTR